MSVDLFHNRKQADRYRKEMSKLPPLSPETVSKHVDFGFIKQLEGFKLRGYVPMSKGAPLGRSGVTIASGFDIGQRSVQDLKNLGLPESLINRFRPYCNKTKWQAVEALRAKPLSITSEEAELINSVISVSKVRGIIDTVGEELWNKMDLGLRTVLASVQFQYGDARSRTPNFFRKVLSLDVGAVISHLENFGDKYPTRRRIEANYLRQISLRDNGTTTV